MNSVAKLYDNLFILNSKRKENEVYPIHKTLNYENKEIKTLYSFLLKEFDISENGNLLDCGCGVGYGSLLIADEKPNLKIHGISLSGNEIELAKEASQKEGLQDRCEFKIQSFDDVPANTYDCIIAIESLKHSPDIEKTMEVLTDALRPKGKLYIIEDVGKKPVDNFAARRQCKDWALPKICTVDDYHRVNGLTNHCVKNMTPYIKSPNLLLVLLRVLFGEFLVLLNFLGIKNNGGSKIIRGGGYQELLYATRKIDYLILTASKEA